MFSVHFRSYTMEALFNSLLADEPLRSKPPTIQPLYGGNEKAVQDMSLTEWSALSARLMVTVRERAFSRGLPIIYALGNQVVREYADGRIELTQ
jgi:hypothetical protein